MLRANNELWGILIESGIPKTHSQGSIIYLQDTPCKGLYCIVKGRVKNCRLLSDGSETILTICQKNTIISEIASLDNWLHITTAIALTHVEAVLVPTKTVRSIIRARPHLAYAIIESMGKKLYACVTQVSELSDGPVQCCLAKLLLTLENYGIEKESGEYYHITHSDLGGMAGTTRPYVTVTLKKFAQEGLIELKRGKLRIINSAELDNIASSD